MNGNCYFQDYYLESDFSPQGLDFPPGLPAQGPTDLAPGVLCTLPTPTLHGEPASNSIPQARISRHLLPK